MKPESTFKVGQMVERKGKFYIVSKVFPQSTDPNLRDLGVRAINKKTGMPWQATMYFSSSEFKSA